MVPRILRAVNFADNTRRTPHTGNLSQVLKTTDLKPGKHGDLRGADNLPGIKSLANPTKQLPMESNRYKKHGGGGVPSYVAKKLPLRQSPGDPEAFEISR